MKNLLKHFLLLSLPLTLALGFASCDKDNDKDAPESLVGTTWTYTETRAEEGEVSFVLNFLTATTGELNEMEIINLAFTYTYQKGSGTITLPSGENGQAETYNFTVEGNHLTVYGPEGQSIVFTRTSGGGNTPPDPGEVPASLVGTYWSFSYSGVTLGFNFLTDTTGELISSGFNVPFRYTYQNGSGTINVTDGGEIVMTYTFTVAGNKMTIRTQDGNTMVLTRGEAPEPPADNPMIGTTWSGSYDGVTISLSFLTASSGVITTGSGNVPFSYTYDNGEGDISIDGETFGHYVVNGDMMLFSEIGSGGEPIVLTRGSSPVPPDPGETPESLVGTSWTFQATYGDVTIGQQLIFTTATNVTMRIYEGDDEEMIYTTYTYSNGAGVVYAPEGETGDVPFTVQGNTLVAAFGEMPLTFYRD